MLLKRKLPENQLYFCYWPNRFDVSYASRNCKTDSRTNVNVMGNGLYNPGNNPIPLKIDYTHLLVL